MDLGFDLFFLQNAVSEDLMLILCIENLFAFAFIVSNMI